MSKASGGTPAAAETQAEAGALQLARSLSLAPVALVRVIDRLSIGKRAIA